MAQMVDCLPNKTLSKNPSTPKGRRGKSEVNVIYLPSSSTDDSVGPLAALLGIISAY
jgi:hypothetical protein